MQLLLWSKTPYLFASNFGVAAFASLVVFQKWRWTEIAVTLDLIFVVSLRKEWSMTFIAVRCPHCQSNQIVKRGKTARGTQRYLCQNTLCVRGSFLLDYCNRGCLPEVKQTIIDMSLNASGVRDTARSLHIGPNIEKLPYGATECFCSPDRWFDCLCGVHFAEKEA